MKRLFVVLTAIALVGAFTATAMAADWGFYGSSRMTTFYTMTDKGDQLVAPTDNDSDSGTTWAQQGNSRIGANVKASDNLVGRFEYGNSGGNANIRILWAEYDFGGMKLGLGQNYTPVHAWVSSQVFGDDGGLLDVGGIYASRKDMIRLTMAGGAFKLAFIEPSTTGAVGDADPLLPKIEARFDLPLGDSGRMAFMGGFNMIDFEDAAGDESGSITSYVVGVMGAHGFGSMYVNWDLFMAQNRADYGLGAGWVIPTKQASAVVDATDLSTEDSTSMGALIAFGMSFSDTMGMELGVGYVSDDNDAVAGTPDDPDTTMAAYFQLPITMAAGFTIIPEVGSYMGGEDGFGNDDLTVTYFGAKWQMNF